ncbi:MAG TPA: RNA 2',3'-cyclic phosphodiesterase [Herpetosiphonaceae bacterium]|nr:RNA 2',3'-cyclic phosphodiesterase [Herpetosiphonaceae bacterium]
MDHWRLFIGMLLPEATRAAIEPAAQALRSQGLAVRWVRPENWHITLHFLGNVDPAAFPALDACFAEEVAGLTAPTLRCHALGAFPNERKPRVLWAGVSGDKERLGLIHAAAVAAGRVVGVEPERRPYTPHVTLGYVRDQAGPAERAAGGAALGRVGWTGDSPRPYPSVALIRSTLTKAGSAYTPLRRIELLPSSENNDSL